jgi:hypothetical protein
MELQGEDPITTPREGMLGDLVTNTLPGKTAAEIEDVLGPSVETDYFASSDQDFIYYMGPERSSCIQIDSEWLLIRVGKDGRFERYSVGND